MSKNKPEDYRKGFKGTPLSKAGWFILDRETKRPYLNLGYLTEEEGKKGLADLLAPYPKRHEWRKRLKLVPALPGLARTYS